MKKLIEGIVDFRKNLTKRAVRGFLPSSLSNKKPYTLVDRLLDSPCSSNLFASTNPGDLFVLRNIGNLIPPVSDLSLRILALLRRSNFRYFPSNISDIVVCGHSECGR